MSIKREAAYHEAAHAVIAHKSRFHALYGAINLMEYGSGEIYLSLSRSKCVAQGKPADSSAQKDKEVAAEIAVILCAGLIGERIASERDQSVKPNPLCAKPDHELAMLLLSQAGLSENFEVHQKAAQVLLRQNWECVERLAEYLFERTYAQADEIAYVIDRA